ncbi:MAG: SPOR domain-containing protein [Bacteroidota bacterium]|nr:SPOR domain-containing protein [Bacteroidota bacterium]
MTKKLLNSLITISIFIVFYHGISIAQVYERKIFEYVRLISEGQSEAVAPKISDLKKKIPRSAGIIYIEGLIATDEDESIRCFSIIADSFPRSEWADDALARLFEYHFHVGTSTEAEASFQKLYSKYPSSPYITTGYIQQERLEPKNYTFNEEKSQILGQEFAVQVGAFSIRENAEKLRAKFSADGYQADIYENLLDGKNLLYLVWIGSFKNPEHAHKTLLEIKAKYNIECVIRQRSGWKKW